MRRKIIHLTFIFMLALGFVSINASKALAAEDDITGIALEKEMRDLIQRGIMAGYGEGEYRPGEDVTRGQFAALITRALKLPEATGVEAVGFSDVPTESKLADEIYRASKAGIINGYRENDKFGPNDKITREQ